MWSTLLRRGCATSEGRYLPPTRKLSVPERARTWAKSGAYSKAPRHAEISRQREKHGVHGERAAEAEAQIQCAAWTTWIFPPARPDSRRFAIRVRMRRHRKRPAASEAELAEYGIDVESPEPRCWLDGKVSRSTTRNRHRRDPGRRARSAPGDSLASSSIQAKSRFWKTNGDTEALTFLQIVKLPQPIPSNQFVDKLAASATEIRRYGVGDETAFHNGCRRVAQWQFA